MATRATDAIGRVTAIWRYPVKSMMGEELEATEVTERGLLGDRAYALIDSETGKVASAKNPRRWPGLLDFRAVYLEATCDPQSLPAVRITLHDGESLTTEQADAESRLSAAVGRRVTLARAAIPGATAEGYWPDHDWLEERDQVFEFALPPGTFFDGAMVHLVTTASLRRLYELAPGSRLDPRRFRPNLVIETEPHAVGFVESEWIGRTLTAGDVILKLDRPCPRCVMTTLKQHDLPKDPDILRTLVQSSGGNFGLYASVIQGGRVARDADLLLS
jgi:uncharacterized protein YcbX